MDNSEPIISICVCTFRRPLMLDRLISSIQQDLILPGPTEMILVDNDADGSAWPIVEKLPTGPIPVHYFVEPEQNIALARNRSLSEAKGEWIAIIDDDEIPDRDWLASLFQCAQTFNADAVFGPVEPIFSNECPKWIIEGRFFEGRRSPTGSEVPMEATRTSNVILRRALVSDREGPFDPHFGLSGGSDGILFGQLLMEGKRFHWCGEAVVREHIPADRSTWQWLLKRSFRGGQTLGRAVLSGFGRGRPSLLTRVRFLSRAAVALCVAVPVWLLLLPIGKKHWFRWLRRICTQFGKIFAFTPFVYLEYAERR